MKYIIEIKPEYEGTTKGIIVLGIKNNCLCVDGLAVEELEVLNAEYINNHFPDITKKVEEAYQRGLEDGKAVHEKGCEGCKYGGTPQGDSQCFNCSNYYKNNWTAKDDKIVVGDEVCNIDPDRNDTGIVTWRMYDDIYIMYSDGSAGRTQVKYYRKTGRHFDIASILEEMKE